MDGTKIDFVSAAAHELIGHQPDEFGAAGWHDLMGPGLSAFSAGNFQEIRARRVSHVEFNALRNERDPADGFSGLLF